MGFKDKKKQAEYNKELYHKKHPESSYRENISTLEIDDETFDLLEPEEE